MAKHSVSNEELELVLKQLDKAISMKQQYRDARKHRIDSLDFISRRVHHSQLDKIYRELYEENSNFNGKEALMWLNLLDTHMKGDIHTHLWTQIRKARVLTVMGLYSRASDLIQSLDTASMSKDIYIDYYDVVLSAMTRIEKTFQSDIATTPEDKAAMIFICSHLASMHEEGSTSKAFAMANQFIWQKKYDKAEAVLDSIEANVHGHDTIYINAIRGDLYIDMGKNKLAMYYLAKASIDDIQSGITEYMCLPMLVKFLYANADYGRAYDYLICCMEDQSLYPASFLNMHAGTIFPVINRAHSDYTRKRQESIIIKFVGGTLILITILTIIFATILIRNHKKHSVMLKERNDQLNEVNSILEDTNKKLEDTNIKLEDSNRALEDANINLGISNRRLEDSIQQLAIANTRLHDANETKSNFLNNMSHELRTPLNAIQGFTEVLCDDNTASDPSIRQQITDIIRQNTDHLAHLIDDAMELSAYDNDSFVPELTYILLGTIIDGSIVENTSKIKEGITITKDIQIADDFTICTNEGMLRQIMKIILNNAIKFTEQGTVNVSCTANSSKAIISISDTGCGVPKEKAEYIFERFTKLDEFIPGTGLGLALCRVLASKLEASVYLDTSYTQGARFIIELPIR